MSWIIITLAAWGMLTAFLLGFAWLTSRPEPVNAARAVQRCARDEYVPGQRPGPFPVDTAPLLIWSDGPDAAAGDGLWRATLAAADEADRLYLLGREQIGELA